MWQLGCEDSGTWDMGTWGQGTWGLGDGDVRTWGLGAMETWGTGFFFFPLWCKIQKDIKSWISFQLEPGSSCIKRQQLRLFCNF